MFNAELISLSDGQSYEHVAICEEEDLDKLGVPKLFEEWTTCFFADKKQILCHVWNISLIYYDRKQRSGPGAITVERIILTGDISYAPARILPVEVWRDQHNIPLYFPKRFGFEGQMVFSCGQGTILSPDINVSSIIIPNLPTPIKPGTTNLSIDIVNASRVKK